MGDDEVKPLPDGATTTSMGGAGGGAGPYSTVVEPRYDSTGQLNGPTDAEQAAADAAQLELVNAIRAKNALDEQERQRLLNEKIQRAIDADAERRSLIERMKLLEARVTALERGNG